MKPFHTFITGLLTLALSLAGMATPVNADELAIITSILANGNVDTPYTDAFMASGGTPPYSWKGSGILPPGLAVAVDGTVSGTPTSGGTYTFMAKVTDATAATVSKQVLLTIISLPVTHPALKPVEYANCTDCHTAGQPNTGLPVTTFKPGDGTPTDPTALPYAEFIFSANKPVTKFECSLDSAPLATCSCTTVVDNGITYCVVYYPNVSCGQHTFRVRAFDMIGNIENPPVSYSWNSSSTVPTITTTFLPAGFTTIPYSQSLAASCGPTPYTWAISAGTLPTGLSLDSGTGVISGSPTGTGTSAFTVQVTDGNQVTSTKTLSINVVEPQLIRIPVPPAFYPTVRLAYVAVPDNGIIQLAAGNFAESLDMDLVPDKVVNLKGGYDTQYQSNPATSSLQDHLTIQSGSLIIENIVIQ